MRGNGISRARFLGGAAAVGVAGVTGSFAAESFAVGRADAARSDSYGVIGDPDDHAEFMRRMLTAEGLA
ncbi:hypothetical protein AB0P45_21140, partial [Streptomyces niveus]